MITFGYKSWKNVIIRSVSALVLGLLFIVLTIALKGTKYGLFDVLVAATGIGLAVVGVVEILLGIFSNKDGNKGWTIASGIVFIVLGIVMFSLAQYIMGAFCICLSLLLLIVGLYEVVALVSVSRVLGFATGFFILPCLVTILGAVLLIGAIRSNANLQDAICYLTGASLIVYAVSEIASAYKIRKFIEKNAPVDEQQNAAETETKE